LYSALFRDKVKAEKHHQNYVNSLSSVPFMKQIIACFIALSLVSTSVQAQEGDNYQQMRRTFAAPNDVTTSCYWYWISGNISREGVINDLKSMKKAGINRAFIGNQGVGKDEAPRGNVKIQSP